MFNQSIKFPVEDKEEEEETDKKERQGAVSKTKWTSWASRP